MVAESIRAKEPYLRFARYIRRDVVYKFLVRSHTRVPLHEYQDRMAYRHYISSDDIVREGGTDLYLHVIMEAGCSNFLILLQTQLLTTRAKIEVQIWDEIWEII